MTPCDIADPAAVEALVPEVLEALGGVSALVNSAGTNTPRRGLGVLSVESFRQLIDVNLNGTFYCVHAFLPLMRRRGGGTIVNIVSDAGLVANAKAGAAYVAGQVRRHGPHPVDQRRGAGQRHPGLRHLPRRHQHAPAGEAPSPPPPEAREMMLQPEDVADCVMLALNLPGRAVVEQLVIRPR